MVSLNPRGGYRVVVLAPVYDDDAAAALLLQHLERAFTGSGVELQVLLVDDGSPVPLIRQFQPQSSMQVDVLRLKRNVGHQRAIALGTAYVQRHIPCDAMLVMDADGEDRPEDAVQLVARCREQENEAIVFAERTRRSESTLFRGFYWIYQLLHWFVTGIRIPVGNFSVAPAASLAALVTLPALWNHFAAAIFHARLPRELVPTIRGQRYSGHSKMNFVGLVVHGLQAISVFIEVVTVRLLLAVCLALGGCGLLVMVIVAARFGFDVAIPTWSLYLLGELLIVGLALSMGSFALTLGYLARRNTLDFIPMRDYRFFIQGIHRVVPRHLTTPEVFRPVEFADLSKAANE